jgi:hypothetical protein
LLAKYRGQFGGTHALLRCLGSARKSWCASLAELPNKAGKADKPAPVAAAPAAEVKVQEIPLELVSMDVTEGATEAVCHALPTHRALLQSWLLPSRELQLLSRSPPLAWLPLMLTLTLSWALRLSR